MKKIYFSLITVISYLSTLTIIKAEYTLDKAHPEYRPINSPANIYTSDAQGISFYIGEIITLMLQLAGGVAVFFIVFGGFLYVTAMGEQGNMDKAKRTITWAILGLLAIILSYAIVQNLLKIIFNIPIDTTAGM